MKAYDRETHHTGRTLFSLGFSLEPGITAFTHRKQVNTTARSCSKRLLTNLSLFSQFHLVPKFGKSTCLHDCEIPQNPSMSNCSSFDNILSQHLFLLMTNSVLSGCIIIHLRPSTGGCIVIVVPVMVRLMLYPSPGSLEPIITAYYTKYSYNNTQAINIEHWRPINFAIMFIYSYESTS